MEKKRIGFPFGVRLGLFVGVLVILVCLLLADVSRTEGIFRCWLGKYSRAVKDLSVPSLGSGTSVVAVQRNFHVVAPGIWRSAQPDPESLRRLKSYGLKSIVNLRLDGEAEPWENKWAEGASVHYFPFPLSASSVVPAKTVDDILSILSDPKNQPVLVHCYAGKDRAGMIIAAYKLANTGWSFRDIYQEMKMYGFNEKYLPMLATLRLWSVAHGKSEMAREIALNEKKLTGK